MQDKTRKDKKIKDKEKQRTEEKTRKGKKKQDETKRRIKKRKKKKEKGITIIYIHTVVEIFDTLPPRGKRETPGPSTP